MLPTKRSISTLIKIIAPIPIKSFKKRIKSKAIDSKKVLYQIKKNRDKEIIKFKNNKPSN